MGEIEVEVFSGTNMEIQDEIRLPRIRYRRQAAPKETEENLFEKIEHEIEDDADIIANRTGLPSWSGKSGLNQ